jgi:predicted acylesterase/phospholipase RssA
MSARHLLVLADGGQAAFAAGAVAALAAAGSQWNVGWGSGLGAQVAILALLGEAEEGARRWRRWAENGASLLRSRIGLAREALANFDGVTVGPDPWRLDGWLDGTTLAEHLAPDLADVPGRLGRAGTRCAVGVSAMSEGRIEWIELTAVDAATAATALAATATFPGGWGPNRDGAWGGAACALAALPVEVSDAASDVVCGFPVPAVARPSAGVSLFELVQRRDELLAAAWLQHWLVRRPGGDVRLVAPEPGAYAAWAARDGADLGVEYPLPSEHNAALVGSILSFGRHAGEAAAAACGT